MGDSQYSFSLTTFRFNLSHSLSISILRGWLLWSLRCIWLNPVVVIFFNFLMFFWNSPSGKLVQIEHALMAVGSGQTSLGIKGTFLLFLLTLLWLKLSKCMVFHQSWFLLIECCLTLCDWDNVQLVWSRDICLLEILTFGVAVCVNWHLLSYYTAANGVVVATEKKLPSILVDETSVSN